MSRLFLPCFRCFDGGASAVDDGWLDLQMFGMMVDLVVRKGTRRTEDWIKEGKRQRKGR